MTEKHRPVSGLHALGTNPRQPLIPIVLIGIGIAIAAALMYAGLSRGIASYVALHLYGITTSGEVTSITPYERVSDSGERRDNLRSTIRYTDYNGVSYTMDDPRPAQPVGSRVTVRYLKYAPQIPTFESDVELLGVDGASIVFALFVFLATAYFGRQWYRRYHRVTRLRKKGVKIPGKVINIKSRTLAPGGGAEICSYHIVVEFLLPHAATPIHATSAEFQGTPNPSLYDTVVTVYVDPRNDRDFFIDPSQPYGLHGIHHTDESNWKQPHIIE